MPNPDANDYDVLTFDCYGTLIDWGKGIVDHLQAVLLERDAHVIGDFLLEFFAATEPEVQADGIRYADVLREVLRRLGSRLGFTPSDEVLDAFAGSVADWPPFPDTLAALERLQERFDLVVVSNVDNALFAETRKRLGVEFKHVVTAEDVGAYKPDRRMFDRARDVLNQGRSNDARILHVAQSVYHDIEPATALGLPTAWIRRARNAARGAADAKGGADARSENAAKPTWTFDSLSDFADAMLGPA